MGFYVFHSLVLTNSVSVFIPPLIKFILNIIYILPFCKYPSTYWWVDNSPEGRRNDGVEGEILPYRTLLEICFRNKIKFIWEEQKRTMIYGWANLWCAVARRLKGRNKYDIEILFGFPILYMNVVILMCDSLFCHE